MPGLLVFLYARRSVEAQMVFERYNPRVNESLALSVDGENVTTVCGEGKLYASDMAALLRNAGMKKGAVRDVIVGDGITEIGANVFNDFDQLQSLKLGEGVVRVAAGGVKQCPRLRYLYFPAGLKDVALDFLYKSPKCMVVTGVKAAELPDFANVKKKTRVLQNIDSCAALTQTTGDNALPEGVLRWWPEKSD